ncbi:MAG: AAA family ATPase [Clostridiales bacterium]|nr:AAA family ATPase [Clostridiales bacterium]
MERSLFIKNFRNIGIGEGRKLILNRSIEKGKMGNLIILIGENNSGKSNVLDALEAFGKQVLQERDKTTLSFADKDRTPKLTLSYKVSEKESYTYSIDSDKKVLPRHTLPNGEEIDTDCLTKQAIAEFVDGIQNAVNQYGLADGQINQHMNGLLSLTEPIDPKKADDLIRKLVARVETVAKERQPFQRFIASLFANNSVFKNNPISNFYAKLDQSAAEKSAAIKREFYGEYGFEMLPQIYRYKENPISTADLSTEQSRIFIDKVFRAIGVSPQEVETAYNVFKQTKDHGALETEEYKLNERLTKLSDRFNTIYYRGTQTPKDAYRFKINLERSCIYFSIYRGDKNINLDYQSTGFKWFFNLYFNLMFGNDLKSGDIIIMDEPATNLHVRGQEELRKFLKEFAVANDLTIIIATHSPFLIDLDYLDELRVVLLREGQSYIHNDFSVINGEDPDTLKPIKHSLTVNNHVLLNTDANVVFVEGITDYNYMTAFKNILGKEDIVFIPINGLGDPNGDIKTRHKEIVKTLQRIKKHGPILMVDGDAAGKDMKKFCEKNESELKVFSLGDVDPEFKTIESLFSEADIKKYELKAEDGTFNKKSSMSSALKTYGGADSFSKKTIENFKKLFACIEEF